jgi:uncharacterized protein YdeI (YjbR/CyaY-like superfamily)
MTTPSIVEFKRQSDLRKWLSKNHALSDGIWIRIFKKGSEKHGVTYAQALDESLCFGWIDSQKKSWDEISWIQKFCQRRAKSNWSKINVGHAERLIAAGMMTEFGLIAIEAAKTDGRWTANLPKVQKS